MDVLGLLGEACRLQLRVWVDGDRLQMEGEATTEVEGVVVAMGSHKSQVMAVLLERERQCRNALTPHATHEFPWECDPDSCYCRAAFGAPRLCESRPCRWVWPEG